MVDVAEARGSLSARGAARPDQGAASLSGPDGAGGSAPEAGEVRAQQIATLARHTPINTAVPLVTSSLVAVALWDGAPYGVLLLWLGVIWAMGLWHFGRWWRRRGRAIPRTVSLRTLRRAAATSTLAGAAWGATAFLFPMLSQADLLLMAIVICAMGAGASTTLGAVPAAAAGFILSAILPWIVTFLLLREGDYTALAGVSVIYTLAMLASTRIIHQSFLESVQARRTSATLLTQLRDAQETWLRISDSAEAFALFDGDDRLVLWNDGYRRMLSLPDGVLRRGAPRAEVLGRAAAPAVTESGDLSPAGWLERQMALPDRPNSSFVHRLETGCWLKSSAHRTADGYLVTSHVDVTEQKRREGALAESETRLKAFMDHSPLEMAVKDRDGRYVIVNRQFEQLYDVDGETVRGKTSRDLFSPEVASSLREHDNLVLRQRRIVEREEVVPLDDGDHTFLAVKFPLLDSAGEVSAIGAVAMDITERKQAEQALRASEQKYRNLIEGSIQGVLIHRDWKPLFLNQALAEMLGYDDAGEILAADSISKIVAPEDRERLAGYRDARQRGEASPTRHTSRYLRKDGSVLWLEAINSVVEWDGGPAIQSAFVDVTEQVQAFEALRESEQRFRDFAEASADWFWEIDADFRFTYVSPNMERMLGVPRDGLYGKPREALWDEGMDAAARDAHVKVLRAHEPFRDFVYPLKTEAGGERRWMRSSGVPLFGECGEFLGYRGSGSEVTRAVKAEQAVKESEEQLRLVTDSLPVLIIYVDRDERILFANRTCCEWHAKAREDIVGHSLGSLLGERHRTYAAHIDAVSSGESIMFDDRARYGDGKTRDIEAVYVPSVLETGEVGGFFVLASDVTERKTSEQALREREARLHELQRQLDHVSRINAMGQLSSALAHELNQPLTAIINYIQAGRRLMRSGNAAGPGKADAVLDKAVEQSARAGDVIRRLRGLFERGETEVSPHCINDVVQDAASLALLDATAQGITSKWNLSPDLPRLIIDRIQIQQVVVNLVRNAVEALEGAEQREIVIETSRDENGGIRVAVLDSGKGLPEGILDRLFDPFVTSKHTSMGVGLSISDRIVRAHGGTLAAGRDETGRTRVAFTLPATEDGVPST